MKINLLSGYWCNKKFSQSGRSMVEILGTLAIMGVLSIGGIAAYSYAMDKHRANQTIKDVTLYAMTASQQMLSGHAELNFSELGNTSTVGYPIDGEILPEDENYFEIFVQDVPTSVCERIVDTGWQVPLAIYVNDTAYVDSNHICDADGNETPVEMAFQFVSDLNEGAFPFGTCEQASDCAGNCAKCEDGLCVSACTSGEVCLKDITTGSMTCCNAENKSGPYCCPSTKNGMCCNEAGQCCPWNRPLVDKSGNCYACDYENGVDVTGVESNCNTCSNREVFKLRTNGETTNYCVPKCSAGQWQGHNGTCYDCDDPKSYYFSVHGNHPDDSQCSSACNGMREIVAYKFCNLKCQSNEVKTKDGCRSCSDMILGLHGVDMNSKDDINEAQKECEKCSATHTFYDDNICVVECEAGQFRGKNGICYDCNVEKVVASVGSSAVKEGGRRYCETACPGIRVSVPWYTSDPANNYLCAKKCAAGEYMAWDGSCNNCETGPNKNATPEECAKCTNRIREGNVCRADCGKNKFRGADGVCYDCTEPNPILYGAECTKQCSNRVLNGIIDGVMGKYCSLPCPDGYFANGWGECISCDTEESVELYSQAFARSECEKCSDERNLYYNTKNGYICMPKCPVDAPLRGMDNECYSCNTERRVRIGSYIGICETECPNERKVEGEYCVLK